MEKTASILQALGIDKRVISLYEQEIKIPYLADSYRSFNETWYPHPPFLIPIFIDYSFPILKGIIYHPFSARNITMVTYDLEVVYAVEEARTVDQFLTEMVLQMDMHCEGLTEEILKFCDEVGYVESQAVDKFAEKRGDNPDYFHELVYFDTMLPLNYCKNLDTYDGDYVSSEKIFNIKMIDKACSFEITNRQWLNDVRNPPAWLVNKTGIKKLFAEYLEHGAWESAWFALNSDGWTWDDRADGLAELSAQSKNEMLKIISENWLSGFKAYQKRQ